MSGYKYRTFFSDEYFHGSPLKIKSDIPYILAGDNMVDDYYRIRHKLEKPQRCFAGAVFKAEESWEGGSITSVAVLKRDNGSYGMWYTGAPFDCDGRTRTALCYAESKDGVSFIRAQIGKSDICGNSANNVIALFGEKGAKISVVRLDDGRYAFALNDGEYISVVLSDKPTDIDFSSATRVTAADNAEFTPRLAFDENAKKWQMICRPASSAKPSHMPAVTARTANTVYNRRLAVAESADLTVWSAPREFYSPDRKLNFTEADSITFSAFGENPVAFIGHSNSDCGYLAANRYKTVYLALDRNVPSLGMLEDPEPLFEHGTPDLFDEYGVDIACGGFDLFGDGREYYYYLGMGSGNDPSAPSTQVGILSFAEGRYASRSGGRFGGWLLTREFYFNGSAIEIDADIPRGGSVAVELLCGDNGQVRGGRVVLGRDISSCDGTAGRNGRFTVSWSGETDLSFLRGRSVFIRFGIKNAKLYSFTVKS